MKKENLWILVFCLLVGCVLSVALIVWTPPRGPALFGNIHYGMTAKEVEQASKIMPLAFADGWTVEYLWDDKSKLKGLVFSATGGQRGTKAAQDIIGQGYVPVSSSIHDGIEGWKIFDIIAEAQKNSPEQVEKAHVAFVGKPYPQALSVDFFDAKAVAAATGKAKNLDQLRQALPAPTRSARLSLDNTGPRPEFRVSFYGSIPRIVDL